MTTERITNSRSTQPALQARKEKAMNYKIIIIGILTIFAGTIALLALPTDKAVTPVYDLSELPVYENYASASSSIFGNNILFSIPIGKDGITYDGLGYEQIPWGPSALKIDAEGDFWIADAAAHRLLEYDKFGNQLSIVDLSNSEIVSIHDFALVGDEIAVLDLSNNEPAIVWVDYSGNISKRAFIPYGSSQMFTKLFTDAVGNLVVEIDGGAKYALVGRTDDSRVTVGKSIQPPARINQISDDTRIEVTDGSTKRVENFQNDTYGSVLFLLSRNGSIFAETVETYTRPDYSFDVDTIIHRYDSKLRPNGVARIPSDKEFVFINSPFTISSDDSIFYLLGAKDAVYVLKLRFFRELPNVLPQGPPPVSASGILDDISRRGLSESPTSCVRRSTMMDRAWAYRSNEIYLKSANISGSCPGRSRPHYLSTPKYYFSVSYDWGGFDTVDLFNYSMGIGRQAGDINSSIESCSRGVDCSGFVSRVWGLSSKYSTTTLPSISTRLSSRKNLLQGDIANKSGVHTAVFYSTSGDSGAYWYESTTYNNLDKVSLIYHPWSYFEGNGYKYYRYNNACP